MHHESFLYDLVRAHERDLRSAADHYRLARSARPDGPAFLDRVRTVALARLARGARRPAPTGTGREPFPAATARPCRTSGRRQPEVTQPAESCC